MKRKIFILSLFILSSILLSNKVEAFCILGEGNSVEIAEVFDYNASYVPNREGYIDETYTSLGNQPIKITDDGRFNNPYDVIDFSNYSNGFNINDFKQNGYKTMVMEISFYVMEISEGYQYIYIYSSSEEDSYLIGCKFSHSSELNDEYYHFYFEIDLNNIINNYLYVRYDASGSGNDDWVNYVPSFQLDFSYDYRITNRVYYSHGIVVDSSSYEQLPIAR